MNEWIILPHNIIQNIQYGQNSFDSKYMLYGYKGSSKAYRVGYHNILVLRGYYHIYILI